MFTIQSNSYNPYEPQIIRFLVQEFEAAFNSKNPELLLDLLTHEIIGTTQFRYAPVPNPESLVSIRKVIEKSIAENLPIPILSPWGGRKTKADANLDIAELMAIKQLTCLNTRISKFYSPGIDVNIRLEDTGAEWLYRKESNIFKNVEKYSLDFQKLLRIMDINYIHPIRESSLMERNKYFELSGILSTALLKYIIETDLYGLDNFETLDSYKALIEFGWTGQIPKEQRNYYTDRYKSLYPNLPEVEYNKMLADYLGGSLARYILKGTADNPKWEKNYIQISFVPPVPGAPKNLVSRNIYYRTIFKTYTRAHIAPWRAKGYLEIQSDNSINPKVISWNQIPENIEEHCMEFSNASETIKIQADYVLL